MNNKSAFTTLWLLWRDANALRNAAILQTAPEMSIATQSTCPGTAGAEPVSEIPPAYRQEIDSEYLGPYELQQLLAGGGGDGGGGGGGGGGGSEDTGASFGAFCICDDGDYDDDLDAKADRLED